MGTIDDTSEKLRFGRDLAFARERIGKNRSDFAADMGVSANGVKKWEDGTSFPVPSKWNDIKNILGIDPQSYKLRNEEPEPPQPKNKPKPTQEQELNLYKNRVIELTEMNDLLRMLVLARDEKIVVLEEKLAAATAQVPKKKAL